MARLLLLPWLLFLSGSSAQDSSSNVATPSQVYRTTIGQGETFGFGNGLSAGKANDGIMYAVTEQGTVYTLRESDGSQLNVYSRNGTSATSSSHLSWESDGSMGVYAADDNIILIDTLGNYVKEFTSSGTIAGQPIISNGRVYVSSNQIDFGNGLFTVFNVSDSAVLAHFTLAGLEVGPCNSDTGSHVYFGTTTGSVQRVDVETLARSVVVNTLGENMTGTPYASSDDQSLLLQSASGKLHWWAGGIIGLPRFVIIITDDSSGKSWCDIPSHLICRSNVPYYATIQRKAIRSHPSFRKTAPTTT